MSHPHPAGLSPPTASRATIPSGIRVLAVGGDAALLQDVCGWAGDMGAHFEHAPDLPRAARVLGTGQWDVILAVLAEQPEEELSWWVDALRSAPGTPKLIGLAHRPSMSLVL